MMLLYIHIRPVMSDLKKKGKRFFLGKLFLIMSASSSLSRTIKFRDNFIYGVRMMLNSLVGEGL